MDDCCRLAHRTANRTAGYFGTVVLLLTRSARFRELMTEELRRRRLGPFSDAEPAT